MSGHVKTCANCGTGPDALRPASVSCCWNPVGCGCWVPARSGSEPASAGLRETQQALAASQADLTRVERERDGVREELARQVAAVDDLTATLAMRTGQLTSARIEIDHLKAELLAAFELLAASKEPTT